MTSLPRSVRTSCGGVGGHKISARLPSTDHPAGREQHAMHAVPAVPRLEAPCQMPAAWAWDGRPCGMLCFAHYAGAYGMLCCACCAHLDPARCVEEGLPVCARGQATADQG
jgi:hypothetical protein